MVICANYQLFRAEAQIWLNLGMEYIQIGKNVRWGNAPPQSSRKCGESIGVNAMVHEVQMGTRKRMSFSRINEVLDMPDLIEIQKNSYERFVKEDLKEVLADISPITDYSEKLVLEFVDYNIDFDHPKYSVEECKERDVNFSAPLRVTVRLINKETGEVKEQPVFMGDFPLMTEQGTFIINGAERVYRQPARALPRRVLYRGHRQGGQAPVLLTGHPQPRCLA